jgi:hypothetical protein
MTPDDASMTMTGDLQAGSMPLRVNINPRRLTGTNDDGGRSTALDVADLMNQMNLLLRRRGPIIGTPSLGQTQALSATSLVAGSPMLGTPSAGQIVPVTATSFTDAGTQEPEPVISRRERRHVKTRRVARNSTGRLWLLQRWQGQILKVGPETFEAQLFDPSDPSLMEHAEFSKTQVTPEQVAFLRPGALFYWFIGYKDIGQTREHVSQIWMRRGGRMDRKKFDEELRKVKQIWGIFDKSHIENTSGG